LKFGVGPDPGGDRRAGYVLSRVPETQQELLEQSLDLAKKCLFTWINEDTLKAMNKYNSIDLRPEAIAEKEEKERKRAQQAQERRERLDRERQESEKGELKNSQSKGDYNDVAQT
jgi:hypothetical protein